MGVWVGGSLGYMDDGGLPNITGAVTSTASGFGPDPSGAFYQNGSRALGFSNAPVTMKYIYMNANRSSSAYSRSDNFVIPRRLNVNYVIKF